MSTETVIASVAAIAAVVAAGSWMKAKEYSVSLPRDIAEQVAAIKPYQYDLPDNILVTGGTGFLGSTMIRAIEAQLSVKKIIAFDLFVRNISEDKRVEVIQGDLLDKEALIKVLKANKIELVIHTASPHPTCAPDVLFKANVKGTETVVEACRAAGVKTLVHTSSASVVWEGVGQEGPDESLPYPKSYRDPYAESKSLAEQVVCAAGKKYNDLATIAIRPHSIYGPGDRQFLPALIEMARKGKTKFLVGDGNNVVDFTYTGNVVHGHLLAAQAAHQHWMTHKTTNGLSCTGKAYFITNDEPIKFWDWLAKNLLGLGYDAPRFRMPYLFLLNIAYIAEFFTSILGKILGKKINMTFSSSRLQLAGTSHWYSVEGARKDLGYKPIWNMDQGLYLSLKAFAAERNKKPTRKTMEIARKGNLVALGLIPDIYSDEVVVRTSIRRTGELPAYTRAEVAKHNKFDDLWLIIDGKVYDLTSYIDQHPGGEAIMNNAGGDASEGFHGPQHPSSVLDAVGPFLIGTLKD